MRRTLLLDVGMQPVAAISWERAVTLLVQGKAELLESYKREIWSRHLTEAAALNVPFFSTTSVTTEYINEDTDIVRVSFKMPAVIRFVRSFLRFRKKGVRFSRHNVYLRDRGECQYCGNFVKKNVFTLDHVIPRTQYGKTVWENVVTCCVACNRLKGSKTPEQINLHLRKKPVKPKTVPYIWDIGIFYREGVPKIWESYIDTRYWHGVLNS